MRVYVFEDREYPTLTELCRAHGGLVLPSSPDDDLLAGLGIGTAERPDPAPTPEETLALAKARRAAAVASIVVEVDGLPFDGDEDAQRRMNNALTVGDLSGQSSTPWVLADDSVREVTRAQLEKALVLSVQRMAELWMLPYAETDTAAGPESGQTPDQSGEEKGGQTPGQTGQTGEEKGEQSGQTPDQSGGQSGEEKGEQTPDQTGQTSGQTSEEKGEQTSDQSGEEKGDQTPDQTGQTGQSGDTSSGPSSGPSSDVSEEGGVHAG